MHTETASRVVTGTRRPARHSGDAPQGATTALLGAGVVAGPLFTLVAAVQVLSRPGFHLGHHALSLLSLGTWGWVQIANFVVSGLLSAACAVGLRRVLRGRRGGTWGPALVGVYGVALVGAGVFSTDPSEGFPPGTPDGLPETLSWHAILHGVVSPIAFVALVAACFVVARWFRAAGHRGWSRYSVLCGVLVIVTMAWPDMGSLPVRMAIGAVLTFGWLATVAARLAAEAR